MKREPDVEMEFSVRAKELRFECKPDVDVVAFADAPATAELQSERENLPDELEPGVTYRDIAVRWRRGRPSRRADLGRGAERRAPHSPPITPHSASGALSVRSRAPAGVSRQARG